MNSKPVKSRKDQLFIWSCKLNVPPWETPILSSDSPRITFVSISPLTAETTNMKQHSLISTKLKEEVYEVLHKKFYDDI